MKSSQRLIGLAVAIVIFTWGTQGHAVDWFDDFSDGNANSPPVQWTASPVFSGDYDASSGDYILTPTDDGGQADPGDENLISTVNGINFTDTSVRTRAVVGIGDSPDLDRDSDFDASGLVTGEDFLTWQRGSGGAGTQSEGDADFSGFIDGDDFDIWEDQFGGPPNLRGGNVGVMARFNPTTGSGYLVVIDNGSQWNLIAIDGFGATQVQINNLSGENVPPIDPGTGLPINAENDLMIQLDVTGQGDNTLLEVWFWNPDDPMPATPAFSRVDDFSGIVIDDGVAGIIYNEDDANTPGIFRNVAASDIHLTDPLLSISSVPEPTCGTLALLATMAAGLFVRPKRG